MTEASFKSVASLAISPGRKLTIPVPEDCSDRYASGWSYADWYLARGGDPDADSPDGWHEEKYAGWWDRLAKEKQVNKV